MKQKLIFLFLIATLGGYSQVKVKDLSGLRDGELLKQLDLNVLSLVPTLDEYKEFKERIYSLPVEYVKRIDSIDYSNFDKGQAHIQIYSQGRAFRSENSYEIKKSKDSDSLLLMNIYLDMRIKDDIRYNEEYHDLKVEYEVTQKTIYTDKEINRIVFSKNMYLTE